MPRDPKLATRLAMAPQLSVDQLGTNGAELFRVRKTLENAVLFMTATHVPTLIQEGSWRVTMGTQIA